MSPHLPLRLYSVTALVVAMLLAVSCERDNREDPGELLAEVGDQQLYAAEINDAMPPSTSSEDSIEFVRDFVRQWCRDAAMLNEADQMLAGDEAVDLLVRNYRESLVLSRYHEQLLAEKLDTEVTEEEILELYDQAGAAMLAEQDLIRATLYKVPNPVPEKDAFEAAWYSTSGSENERYLSDYADVHARLVLDDPDTWTEASRVGALLPEGSLGSVRAGTRVVRDADYVYYLRVLDTVEPGDRLPLAYVRDRISTAILEQRSATLLGQAKDRSYAEARNRNDVKIFVDDEK